MIPHNSKKDSKFPILTPAIYLLLIKRASGCDYHVLQNLWAISKFILHFPVVANHYTILFLIPGTANFVLVDLCSAFFFKYLFLHLLKEINNTCDCYLPLIEKRPLTFCKCSTRTPLLYIWLISCCVLQTESLPELIPSIY